MRNSFSAKTNQKILVAVWLLLIMAAAWFSVGWLQADEHYRVLEPAHLLAYGYASLPWEFDSTRPIVSMLIGVLVAPALKLTRFFGASGLTEAALIRLMFGLISSTRLLALIRCFKHLGLRSDRTNIYLFISCMAIYGPFFFVRTSQENLAMTALLWAFALHFDIVATHLKKRSLNLLLSPEVARQIIFGILLALTVSFRPQAGIAAAGLGLYVWWSCGFRILMPIGAGIFLGLLPLATVDSIYSGGAFRPAMNYLTYALGNEDGGKTWGVSPWWWYIPEFFSSWYPPISFLVIVPILAAMILRPCLGVVVFPFTIVHFLLGHKETRYFLPMIPFVHLATFVGFEALEFNFSKAMNTFKARTKFIGLLYLKFIVAITIIFCFLPLNTSPKMFNRLHEMLADGRITTYTQLSNSMNPVVQFYVKNPDHDKNQKVSLNQLLERKKTVEGWVAGQDLDVALYKKIEKSCDIEYSSIPDILRKSFERIQKSSARNKLNLIFYCRNPFRTGQAEL